MEKGVRLATNNTHAHSQVPYPWRSTYRITANFGEKVVYNTGPIGNTGASQFYIARGTATITSQDLHTLAPGAISAIGAFASMFASRIPFEV